LKNNTFRPGKSGKNLEFENIESLTTLIKDVANAFESK